MLLALGATQEAPVRPKIVLGYYPSWVSRPAPKEIRYDRFTHLAHAFLQTDADGTLKESRAIPNRDLTQRAHQQGVKVLISLGGAQSARSFRRIVASEESRDRYVAAVVRLAMDHGYDGLDLDWEPTEG
ncbi:MAG: glycoside hydrolase family 18 protein, partial [Planctomycetota bacterium]